MSGAQLELVREVAEMCAWCGEHPAVVDLYATPTCQACLDGGSVHRVRVSLQRWKRGAERR